jgi:hypothetical protein
MHPFALYLAATDVEHKHRAAAERNRGQQYATVDALPLNEPAPMSRRDRLIEILRRRVAGAAIARLPTPHRAGSIVAAELVDVRARPK